MDEHMEQQWDGLEDEEQFEQEEPGEASGSETDASHVQGGEESGQEETPLPAQQQGAEEANAIREELLRLRQEKREHDRLLAILQEVGYQGDVRSIADVLEAQQRELSPEQVREERNALESIEAAKMEAQKAREEADRLIQQAVFAADLAEIQKLDPNIKALPDLGGRFFQLRAAGFGNVEAYELVRQAKQGKEQGSAGGKDHLVPTGGGTASAVLRDIPRGELDIWQDSFPDDTPAKLKERYNRALKRQGEK